MNIRNSAELAIVRQARADHYSNPLCGETYMSAYAKELFIPQAAHADEFAAAAMQQVATLPNGSRVLDIGCGLGDLIGRAQRDGVSFTGLDISQPNINAAKRTTVDGDFHCIDLLNFESEPFDLIFSNSVFHLINCSDQVLADKLARLTNPKAKLIASMPIASMKNTILSIQRSAWRRMPNALDILAAKIGSVFFSEAAHIRERVLYLRMPPTRVLDRSFLSTLEPFGFRLSHLNTMSARHLLKLDHAIAVWERY